MRSLPLVQGRRAPGAVLLPVLATQAGGARHVVVGHRRRFHRLQGLEVCVAPADVFRDKAERHQSHFQLAQLDSRVELMWARASPDARWHFRRRHFSASRCVHGPEVAHRVGGRRPGAASPVRFRRSEATRRRRGCGISPQRAPPGHGRAGRLLRGRVGSGQRSGSDRRMVPVLLR